MRIGIDAACWANGRGYGRFSRELVRAMVKLAPEAEFVFFLDERADAGFDLEAPNVTRVLVAQSASPTQAAASDGYRAPGDMLRFTRAVWRERVDVFFSPSVYTYFPLPPGLAALVAVHDAIADRYPELTLPSGRARLFWRLKVGLAVRQARLILTVSDFAARELVEVLRLAPHRIRVAVEAPAAAYRPSEALEEIAGAAGRVGLPAGARWFTYVGGFNPHKRVESLVRAHARLVAEHRSDPPYLVLVGVTSGDVFHSELARIRAAIEEEGTAEYVLWAGFVPDEELRHLHSGALALLLPSVCEGFGLPAVEAAACGTPVIATTSSPLPELLAGGGIFISPEDDDALFQALRRMTDDEPGRRSMGERALERTTHLSWERSARAALGALAEVAA